MTALRLPTGLSRGVPAVVRRHALGWAVGRRAPGDITSLRRLPASTTFALRRDGVDPVPELRHTRERGPVTRVTRLLGLNVWLVTGHAEARSVLADSVRFSNDMRHLLGSRARNPAETIGGLGMTDAPDHTRLRGILTPEFTKHRLARLDGPIRAVVEETLDALAQLAAEDASVDLVPHFAFAIPFRVICDLLGLDEADREEFHALGAARFDVTEGGPGVFGAATRTREFLIETVAQRRSRPGDGLVGAILRDHGDELDDVELGGLLDGVFLGGYETSASMLAMSAYVLAGDPETYALLRTGTPADVDRVVEELLRFLCPVQLAFPRFARADLELAGHRVAAGDVVVVSLPGANRDPRRVPRPEQLDPANAAGGHLSFGHGVHRCVGAELARMELRAALVGLARRFPDLALDPDAEASFRALSLVHSIDALPVRLTSGPA